VIHQRKTDQRFQLARFTGEYIDVAAEQPFPQFRVHRNIDGLAQVHFPGLAALGTVEGVEMKV
jgi:hypothetical protein